MALTATSICNFGWKAPDFQLKGVDGKVYTLDDPQIPIGGLAEHLQRGLIALAVVGGHGLLHAVELDHDHALGDPRLVRFRGVAAREKAPAGGGNGGTRELRVSRQCVRIRNRTIERDPIRLCHCDLHQHALCAGQPEA